MGLSFSSKLSIPPDVLLREVNGESVLLNLVNEHYYALDEIGTRMLTLLTAAESIQGAYECLLAEFDVEPERLRRDLEELIDKLAKNGLLKVSRR